MARNKKHHHIIPSFPADTSTPATGLTRDKLHPGGVVVIRGVIRGKVIAALIKTIHPPGILMTNPDGTESPWTGKMPIIDAVVVDRIPLEATDIAMPGQQWNDYEGEPKIVEKIAWAGDIETNPKFLLLAPWMIEQCPRYEAIAELKGER